MTISSRFCRMAALLMALILPVELIYAAKPPEGDGWNFLKKEMSVTRGPEVVLLPDFIGVDFVKRSIIRNNPKTTIELLYKLPLPEVSENLPLLLFNRVNKFSLMTGLEYYSSRKGRMVRYLGKSFIVEKKGSRRSLPDPVYIKMPDDISYVVYQKDTVFGSNWYNVTVKTLGKVIWLRMENATSLNYFIFPLLPPGGLVIDMIVIPREDYLLFYAVSQLQEEPRKTILGINVYLPGAFDHRISAMEGWFARQIYSDPVPGRIQ